MISSFLIDFFLILFYFLLLKLGQPCKVNMSGSPQCLAIATQLVQEAMLGVKSQGGPQQGYGGEG